MNLNLESEVNTIWWHGSPAIWLNKLICMGRGYLQGGNLHLVALEEDRKMEKTIWCLFSNMTPRSKSYGHRESRYREISTGTSVLGTFCLLSLCLSTMEECKEFFHSSRVGSFRNTGSQPLSRDLAFLQRQLGVPPSVSRAKLLLLMSWSRRTAYE